PCKNSVATLEFNLDQELEIVFEKPDVKRAKVTMEGRIIGLLRSHAKGGGSAEQCKACAALGGESGPVLWLCVPPPAVRGGENLSLNCREGPVSATIAAGKFAFHQTFVITASHPMSLKLCKAASAEFAPDPALDPLWISYWEPFHGAAKKDFGFQVTLKLAEETVPEAPAGAKMQLPAQAEHR